MKKNTLEQLNTIADHLWSEQASLFVGAGFSKNALFQPNANVPPSWDELGDDFILKARKHKPRKLDRAYANVLRLAEEVESMFGRDALISIIREAINDEKLSPSDCHKQLLALPWQDVYTTNYDTLLEKSADFLKANGKRSYYTICDSQDMGMGSSPLLVKLHGNISDSKSIIITEEDYRTYPAKHQAMISSIQHTIMRNTLVLIGFSGNDPNFIQWLGWVKDALNDKHRRVYLLSLDVVSESSLKAFQNKGVVIVDLRGFAGKGSTKKENIESAIKYLMDYPERRRNERTDYRSIATGWGRTSYRGLNAEEVYNIWKRERDTYPGWLVMPRDRREYWLSTDGFKLSPKDVEQFKDGEDLLYLDLFNWRIEKCVFPIENSWESIYLSVLDKYKPFSKRARSEIRLAWINLKLGLLRLYRQEGWREKWARLKDELLPLKEKMSDEQRCRFEYEQALAAVYRNDFGELERVLNNWKEAKTDYYWDIRRGALWAEYISLNKGREITQKAFNCIRDNLDASFEEKERFYWASRMVDAHTVWECMAHANFSDAEDEAKSVRTTWLDLRSYEDIWYEREFFDSNVRSIEDALKVKTKTASFRLGYSSTSTNMGGNSKDYRIAYAYFLYYEEMGFPIHLPYLSAINKQTLGKALSVMALCSPLIAECWMLRSSDPKVVQCVYNRRFLERNKFEYVDSLYKRYLGYLNDLLKEEEKESVPAWTISFRSVLPEILCRLCMKASYEVRAKTLDTIETILRSKNTLRYDGLDNLIHYLVSSFTKEETTELIPRFIGMSIALDRFDDCRLEPLNYAQMPKALPVSVTSTVDYLLNSLGKSSNEDKVILYRLIMLFQCGALTKNQEIQLAVILWGERDATGFPSRTVFSRFAFLSFPHPKEVDPQALLREYFRNQGLPVMGRGGQISFYGGRIPIFNDIKGTTNPGISFDWDDYTLNTICGRLINMWDTDKSRLMEEDWGWGISVKEELQDRLNDVETIISTVMAPHFQMLTGDNQDGLKRIAVEFETHGIPSLRMRIAFGLLREKVVLEDEIQNRLNSTDTHTIVDCISSIKLLLQNGIDVKKYVELISEYFRCNVVRGRSEIIWGLGLFVEQPFFAEDASIRQNLTLGLRRLFDDTMMEPTDDEITANDKMNLRRSVAPIVRELINYSAIKIPQILLIWKDYYENKETCWDIKNSFI